MLQEVILPRDRVACLIQCLTEAMQVPSMYQVKVRIDEKQITIVPHCTPIEMDR